MYVCVLGRHRVEEVLQCTVTYVYTKESRGTGVKRAGQGQTGVTVTHIHTHTHQATDSTSRTFFSITIKGILDCKVAPCFFTLITDSQPQHFCVQDDVSNTSCVHLWLLVFLLGLLNFFFLKKEEIRKKRNFQERNNTDLRCLYPCVITRYQKWTVIYWKITTIHKWEKKAQNESSYQWHASLHCMAIFLMYSAGNFIGQ